MKTAHLSHQFQHVPDLVLRFKLQSEAYRALFAAEHGSCDRKLLYATPEIEKAILKDLEDYKYDYVIDKWGVHSMFLLRLKKKHGIPTRTRAKVTLKKDQHEVPPALILDDQWIQSEASRFFADYTQYLFQQGRSSDIKRMARTSAHHSSFPVNFEDRSQSYSSVEEA